MNKAFIDKKAILAVDVSYHNEQAVAAGMLFSDWRACESTDKIVAYISNIQAYVPGQFFRRELPCILALLDQLHALPDYIVIDGYVYLGKEQKPGLGKYLFDALDNRSIVIGVAKKRFKDTPVDVEIYRGQSKRPLYVTSVGIEHSLARQYILEMCGENRIPVLLKSVDHLCRQSAEQHMDVGPVCK
jgi:deoxyribonuclease V